MNFIKIFGILRRIPLTKIDNAIKLINFVKKNQKMGNQEISCKIRVIKDHRGNMVKSVCIIPPKEMSDPNMIDLSLYLQNIFNDGLMD